MLLNTIMETEQFNIRMSRELIKDLEVISRLLKVSKSEWIKTKLAEEVNEEKNKLLMELSRLYANGLISKKDVEERVGKEIAEEMDYLKKKAQLSVKRGAEYGRKFKG